ncbi:MAG: hydrogenase maturation protease [Gammaproteobacteria bacterium]|nr:hydrogenase maturation protease [Gammaproteobacteria bacterium]
MIRYVLGLGNLLLADEGVGVHAAHALSDDESLEDVTVLDIGTAILDALPALETADRVVVVDAVKADGAPGSVYLIPYEDMARSASIASMHGFDLSRALALTQRSDIPEIVVVGVEPARIDWSMDLSPEVAKSMPIVLKTVKEELFK